MHLIFPMCYGVWLRDRSDTVFAVQFLSDSHKFVVYDNDMAGRQLTSNGCCSDVMAV